MQKNDIQDYIDSIRQAIDRESATSPNTKDKPSPSDILIAAREMMKRAKNGKSNSTNR